MAYVPLWCKSAFSFLEGASAPEALVAQAANLGLPALALTDRCGVYGLVRAWVEARKLGIKLISGSSLSLEDGSELVLLASDAQAYARLCHLLTLGHANGPSGQPVWTYAQVCAYAQGLIALWGGAESAIVRAEPSAFEAVAGGLKDAFGDRLYAMLVRHGCADERAQEARLRERAARYGLDLLANTEVLYDTVAQRPVQDVFTCIRHGVSLHEAGRRLRPNAGHALIDETQARARFQDLPLAVDRSVEIAQRCVFDLSQLHYRYPSERFDDGSTTIERLRKRVEEGAAWRYPLGVPADVASQIEHELRLIDALDYPGYFLTVDEIVRYCRANDILCQGRGSAANSAVCYCLGITSVDPVRTGLLFERFLSMERAEPPDIDLDIAHQRREQVLQHVYQSYGRERAAMVASVIRYRTRGAVRDAGKALGISEVVLDRLSKLCAHRSQGLAQAVLSAGFDASKAPYNHLISLVEKMRGLPRHLSIHPAGFLLGADPVADIVPIQPARMAGRSVIQWDKNDIEALGLFKVDLLALGALTQVDMALKLIAQHKGVALDMASIPAEDPDTFAMICEARTVGVFQIESRAQMSMLPRLRPRTFYDLVIEVSLVRPGPVSGGMVHPYLRRRAGVEPITYAHPSLEPVLAKTLGIPIFQEQVMRLAMIAADYTPGEADQLRRDMAAWRQKGRIAQHHDKLVSRMVAKGIASDFAEAVFRQIEGFGEYGFPESHAASFALIVYATSWIKCHHPDAFFTALLNAQPMGFYNTATILADAARVGVQVRPVDIHQSAWACRMEPREDGGGYALRMGFRFLKGASRALVERLTAERLQSSFSSVTDFAKRTGCDRGTLQSFVRAGVFDSLEADRRQVRWEALDAGSPPPPVLAVCEPRVAFAPLGLFDKLRWEQQEADFSARGHIMQTVRPQLRALALPDAQGVAEMPHGRVVRYVGAVICRQRPHTAGGVVFMTLEDETGFVNLVLWKQVYDRYRVLARTANPLGVNGLVQRAEGIVHIIVKTLWKPLLREAPQALLSRDFH